jgi:hypothetical protein
MVSDYTSEVGVGGLTIAAAVRQRTQSSKACREAAGGGITAIRDQESRVARNKVESRTLLRRGLTTHRSELD